MHLQRPKSKKRKTSETMSRAVATRMHFVFISRVVSAQEEALIELAIQKNESHQKYIKERDRNIWNSFVKQ